jgi:hypothetical protein
LGIDHDKAHRHGTELAIPGGIALIMLAIFGLLYVVSEHYAHLSQALHLFSFVALSADAPLRAQPWQVFSPEG